MMRLLDIIFPPREDEVVIRDVSVDAFLSLINARIVPETRPGAVALLPFSADVVRAAVHEAKYHGNEHAFTLLASALVAYLSDDGGDTGRLGSVRIIPIPLGKARRAERGFNQTEEVARRVSDALATETDPTLLVRTRETASQVSLPRHRREENMRGAFRATHRADPACTYLIVDDVLTTGATLQAAIDALTDAGARDIIPLALAH